MMSTLLSEVVVTVAERTPRSITASSPMSSPGPTTPTARPVTSTCAEPCRSTMTSAPGEPSTINTCPAGTTSSWLSHSNEWRSFVDSTLNMAKVSRTLFEIVRFMLRGYVHIIGTPIEFCCMSPESPHYWIVERLSMSNVTPVLDHLVLATPTLEATARRLEHELGVVAKNGGSHVGRGTRNILMGLENGAYLEIIGVDEHQPAPVGARPFGVDDVQGEHLVAWAARTPNITDLVSAARANGYDPGDVIDMSRARPDGELLAWRLTSPSRGGVTVVPFLIDWGVSEHPSVSLPTGARLLTMRAEHPHAAQVLAELATLDLSLAVTSGSAARLWAEIQGPSGTVGLS